jgi:hypothetical protein
MALTYEQAISEVQKLTNGEEILSHVLAKVHETNKEAQGLRKKHTESESTLSRLRDSLKRHEIDPEGDLEDQLIKIKAKDGLVPSTDMEKLSKELEKFRKDHDMTKKELADYKTAMLKKDQDLTLEKARGAFSPKMSEKFGKSSSVLLDYAISKGQITIKDGIAGVQSGDEFVPLSVERGIGGIDVLAKMYPEFVVAKQVGGSAKPDGRAPIGESESNSMSRADFDILSVRNPRKAMDYVKAGGTFTDE